MSDVLCVFLTPPSPPNPILSDFRTCPYSITSAFDPLLIYILLYIFLDQLTFAPHELEYLKLILDEIMENPMRQIKSTKALNASKNLDKSTKKIQPHEAEMILQKFKDKKWLVENSGNILMSTRFIFEMEPFLKVKNILKGSLDLILSPSPSVKIQVMGGKVCLRCKGKTLLGIVKKL